MAKYIVALNVTVEVIHEIEAENDVKAIMAAYELLRVEEKFYRKAKTHAEETAWKDEIEGAAWDTCEFAMAQVCNLSTGERFARETK